jgi:zinc D-Ala-D-Ala dipeptidase
MSAGCGALGGRSNIAPAFANFIFLVVMLLARTATAQSGLPPGFVYLRDVEASIGQEMRYAGRDNFVGRPLPGYEAPECVLQRDVALALKRVQASVAASGLALKVYDCYRPTRAVHSMAVWANDGRGDGATKRFFPKLHKSSLFGLGYIAFRSQHSSGIAVDLTLVERSTPAAAPFDPAAPYGACSAPAAERSPDNSVDMGTGYDCFDPASHTHSNAISAEQRRRRRLLVGAMAAEGFRNYHREWWHYSYGSARGAHDFPIRPRIASASGAGQ